MKPPERRFTWTENNVSARDRVRAWQRTYIEHAQLRDVLRSQEERRMKVGLAAELGAGFGRMLPVLGEFFESVVGFEREPDLVRQGTRWLPQVPYHGTLRMEQVERLTRIPSQESFDLVMTFTVLQHMDDEDAFKVVQEAKRLAPAGHVLIVEDTDPRHEYQDKRHATHFTYGRSVTRYREWMEGFELLNAWPRQVEAGFQYLKKPRLYVGHYMLFEARQ